MIDAKIVYDTAFNEGLKPDPLLTISEWGINTVFYQKRLQVSLGDIGQTEHRL